MGSAEIAICHCPYPLWPKALSLMQLFFYRRAISEMLWTHAHPHFPLGAAHPQPCAGPRTYDLVHNLHSLLFIVHAEASLQHKLCRWESDSNDSYSSVHVRKQLQREHKQLRQRITSLWNNLKLMPAWKRITPNMQPQPPTNGFTWFVSLCHVGATWRRYDTALITASSNDDPMSPRPGIASSFDDPMLRPGSYVAIWRRNHKSCGTASLIYIGALLMYVSLVLLLICFSNMFFLKQWWCCQNALCLSTAIASICFTKWSVFWRKVTS